MAAPGVLRAFAVREEETQRPHEPVRAAGLHPHDLGVRGVGRWRVRRRRLDPAVLPRQLVRGAGGELPGPGQRPRRRRDVLLRRPGLRLPCRRLRRATAPDRGRAFGPGAGSDAHRRDRRPVHHDPRRAVAGPLLLRQHRPLHGRRPERGLLVHAAGRGGFGGLPEHCARGRDPGFGRQCVPALGRLPQRVLRYRPDGRHPHPVLQGRTVRLERRARILGRRDRLLHLGLRHVRHDRGRRSRPTPARRRR